MSFVQLYSTGPAFVVVGVQTQTKSTTIETLGTFEVRPRIIVNQHFVPIESDEGGGRECPTDYIYVGKDAIITGVMNLQNMPVMLRLMNPAVALGFDDEGNPEDPSEIDLSEEAGYDNVNTLGTIMGRESKTFDLWICFTRNWVDDAPELGLIPGYHFLASFLAGPTELHPGSGDFKQLVTFKCMRKRIPAFVQDDNTSITPVLPDDDVNLVLYDHLGLNGQPMSELPITVLPERVVI